MKEGATARFDARISEKQKEYFEYAAALGGYKTLAAFIFHAAELEAGKIVEQHNVIIASEKDRELFFDAMMNPPKPNERLKKAAQWYKGMTEAK
jgi:uncharacterized protein (DUF1778 family)